MHLWHLLGRAFLSPTKISSLNPNTFKFTQIHAALSTAFSSYYRGKCLLLLGPHTLNFLIPSPNPSSLLRELYPIFIYSILLAFFNFLGYLSPGLHLPIIFLIHSCSKGVNQINWEFLWYATKASPQHPLFFTKTGKMATLFWFQKHLNQVHHSSDISLQHCEPFFPHWRSILSSSIRYCCDVVSANKSKFPLLQ